MTRRSPRIPSLHPQADMRNVIVAVAMVALAAWVAWQLGISDLERQVSGPDGETVVLPNVFTTIDHPYHIARASTLLDSLRDMEILRWVSHHQGGYPVEFYPLGVAWLDVAIWALLAGAPSIAAAHKVAVIVLFVLPGIVFWSLTRLDRTTTTIALAAFTVHIAIPGVWWSGGYTELVLWGLATNVAAYLAAFGFLAAWAAYLRSGGRWCLVSAVVLASLAVATNTRSIVALAAAGAGCVIAFGIVRQRQTNWLSVALARTLLPAILVALITAPLIVSQVRFAGLYTFVQYQWYDGLSDFARSSADAVTLPVLLLGIAGTLFAVVDRRSLAATAAASTLVLYVVATVLLGGFGPEGGLIEQLEPTRLMPFQRLLTIYLAGFGLASMLAMVRNPSRPGPWLTDAALVAASVAILLIHVIVPSSSRPIEERGLFDVATAAQPELASFLDAVEVADAVAPAGTALYVTGSAISWHQQLWAPISADRPFRYDNWLWLWHPWHEAPGYQPGAGHAYLGATVPSTFEQPYLQDQGIGAVIVSTESLHAIADASPDLTVVVSGSTSVYLVDDPGRLMSYDDGSVTSMAINGESISITVVGSGGPVVIRQTWFPRWKASVDGAAVDIARVSSGYMEVQVPLGTHEITLSYAVQPIDWATRIASLVGMVSLVVVVTPWGSRHVRSRYAGPTGPTARSARR